jgi:c-di-GMP phosphodiesterase
MPILSAEQTSRRVVMSDIFIIRQPVFDRDDAGVGYELRYREIAGEGDPFVRSYLSGSFDILRAGLPGYVRCTKRQLTERIFETTDASALVVLLPPDLEPEPEVVEAVAALAKAGMAFGIDEYDPKRAGKPEELPFFAYASHIRIDIRHHAPATLVSAVLKLKTSGKTLVADHVLDRQTRDACKELGFARFQGPYYARPEPLPAAEIPQGTTAALRTMALARDPKSSERDIERAVQADPSLTFQLLRLVNSAAMGNRGVESIAHALRLVGRTQFLRWLALAFATSRTSKSGADQELVRQAVQRARMCELLGTNARSLDAGTLFLVGLFSLIDAVFRIPLPEILGRVKLAPEAELALIDREGQYADALAFVEAYELGLWEAAADIASRFGLSADRVPMIYAESVLWAGEMIPVGSRAMAAR